MEGVTKMEPFWEESQHLTHHSGVVIGQSPTHGSNLQYERNLNFSTVAIEDSEYGFQKKKSARDPLSHRIIEKRRRDRMNNCLADLARLLPQATLRKGRGRIEKTEIVELAIKHLKHLQNHPCPLGENCEFSPLAGGNVERYNQQASSPTPSVPGEGEGHVRRRSSDKFQELKHYRLGYQECLEEIMHFLLERKGVTQGDSLCVQLVEHLNCQAQLINDKVTRACSGTTQNTLEIGLSDGESDSRHSKTNNVGKNENDEAICTVSLPGGYHYTGRRPSELTFGQNRLSPQQIQFEYDGDNSCSSNPLSVDTSDAMSIDGKKQAEPKPPIPSILGNHLSGLQPILGCFNGRYPEDRSGSNHRYKFKSTIKQRFTADLETTPESGGKSCHAFDLSDKSCRTSPCDELRIDDDNESGTGSPPSVDEKPDLVNLTQTTKWASTCRGSEITIVDKLKPENRSGSVPCTMTDKVEGTGDGTWRHGVPAFALHDSGLFYVPLTLEPEFVAPFSKLLDPSSPKPPLHPITISVCFVTNDRNPEHTPAEIKFHDLHVPRGQEALNLCKLSYATAPPNPPGLPDPLRVSRSPFPPLFPTRFCQPAQIQRMCPSNSPEPEPLFANGRDKLKVFSAYELQQRRGTPTTEMFSQSHAPDNSLILPDSPRQCRKRQGNPAPAVASMSFGDHCWSDVSDHEPVLDLVKGEKLDGSKLCVRQGSTKPKNGTGPKRHKKGNVSPRSTDANGFL